MIGTYMHKLDTAISLPIYYQHYMGATPTLSRYSMLCLNHGIYHQIPLRHISVVIGYCVTQHSDKWEGVVT